jgi:mannose PTS system EIIA component
MTSGSDATAPVGILVVAHGTLAASLVECLRHVMGPALERVDALGVEPDAEPEALVAVAQARLAELDDGGGVLVLTDLFGATPSNVAHRLAVPDRVSVLSGANLPMLVRAYAYRRQALAAVADKAIDGGRDGIGRFGA